MVVQVVCIGKNRGAVVAKQLDGFTRHADLLRSRLGITIVRADSPTLDYLPNIVAMHSPDVAIIVPSWIEKPEDIIGVFRKMSEQPVRPKLVFLDTYDPTSSPHFGVLPFVDRYLKSKLLRDMSRYEQDYRGGHQLSDFAADRYNFDMQDWYFGSPLPREHAHKVRACWNFGAGKDFELLLRMADWVAPRWHWRPIDVNRRLGLSKNENARQSWYKAYRLDSMKMLEGLDARHRCTGQGRIKRRLYLWELCKSRVVFSPFGWGEVCFRDYEAVACGALLVKPSMEHVRTSPDIFRAGETYLPVQWDFRDLKDVIGAALADREGSARIARAGNLALREYFSKEGFVQDIANALEGWLPQSNIREIA